MEDFHIMAALLCIWLTWASVNTVSPIIIPITLSLSPIKTLLDTSTERGSSTIGKSVSNSRKPRSVGGGIGEGSGGGIDEGGGDGDDTSTSGNGDGDGDTSTSGDGDSDGDGDTSTSGDGDGDGDGDTSTSGDGDGAWISDEEEDKKENEECKREKDDETSNHIKTKKIGAIEISYSMLEGASLWLFYEDVNVELSPYSIFNLFSLTNCYKLYSHLKSFFIDGLVMCKQYVNKQK